MTQFDTPTMVKSTAPDVFTVLLLVAVLFLAGGVAWMYLVNSDHSKLSDRSDGGPLVLIDQQ
ncbi:MAG: hypothetical protein QF718_05755 [Phycisphaerales bacterium]|jgi:hypothetical protein|nr:hypothetical protein [Phycisphaerales bacterium]